MRGRRAGVRAEVIGFGPPSMQLERLAVGELNMTGRIVVGDSKPSCCTTQHPDVTNLRILCSRY
jgi:hypothetical protein